MECGLTLHTCENVQNEATRSGDCLRCNFTVSHWTCSRFRQPRNEDMQVSRLDSLGANINSTAQPSVFCSEGNIEI